MKKNADVKHLLWLDVETTGLDPVNDRILEVGAILTDVELNELSYIHAVMGYSPEFLASKCSPEVREMHEQSGLWQDVTNSTALTRDVEQALLWYLRQHAGEDHNRYEVVLAGSSVSFDKAFLEAHMPAVARAVHYRVLDVTSFRYALLPVVGADFKYEKKYAHRAMADVHESLAEYKYLVRQFLAWRERGGVPRIALD